MAEQKDKAGTTSGSDVSKGLEQQHEARTTLADESGLVKGATVDARLDNRVGADRPRQVDFPAVPQQIDGPDLAHQEEFTRRYLDNLKSEKAEGLLGQASPGPHGLSSLEHRKGHDRADESGGKAAPDGEQGSPVVGKVQPSQK